MTPHCDLLVRGGTIVDGNGGEPFTGDVAIRDGRIVGVGAFGGEAKAVIDAAGLTVTPGFVDIHTHYDGQAMWSEELSPSSSHGVTTVVIGNCGVGFAPCRAADHDSLIRLMERVEDIPGVVMAEGLSWNWESFPDYLNALDARPRDIDVAALLPHSPLRVFVMGDRGVRREPARPDDLEQMRAITREALDAGAIGFATSRLLIHRTKAGENIPTYQADIDELKAIASAMRDAGTGVLQMVLDAPFQSWRDELSHLLTVAESAGRPATFTLGTSNSGEPVWEEALRICEEANARGMNISPQVLPRPVGMVCGFELSSHPFCLCPAYEAIAGLPLEEQLAYLRAPVFRATLLAQAPHEGNPLALMTRNWNWLFPLSDPPNYEPPAESSVGAQARSRNVAPEEVAYDWLMNGGDGRGMLYATLGNYYRNRLDTIHDLITHPATVMGLGDGGAHYSAICDASYPTFLLTYWTRDRDGPKLSVAKAVQALSSRPADTMGLRDRGRIALGYKADLNVIDLDALHLHAPHVRHDLPGGGRRLDQRATGFVATIVSGEVIRHRDAATGARPGRLVRGAQTTPSL
jgi:N-acyl-D-aspartate/D-glutamate deacylase